MLFALIAVSLSSNEQCMLCASLLQAIQLEAVKGLMTKKELKNYIAEICAYFGISDVCTKINNEFYSILQQLTQVSSGKVCTKIGICKRRKSTTYVVRKAALPVTNDLKSNNEAICFACKAMIPVMHALSMGAPFACSMLSGPVAPICLAIPWGTIQSVLTWVKRGCVAVNCCQRAGLC